MTCEDDVDKQLEKEISQVTAKITEMDQKIQSFTQQLVSKEERQKNVFDLLTTQVWDVVTETKELERAWESFQIQDICDKLALFYRKSSRLEETHQLLVQVSFFVTENHSLYIKVGDGHQEAQVVVSIEKLFF